MKKKGTKSFTLVVFFVVIAALAYYVHLNNNPSSRNGVQENSEKEILLNYDFENNYPKTARETVKLHCRYLKSAYGGMFTDEELFTVNQQIRKLLDDELLEQNPAEKQLEGLKQEIALYEANKQKYMSYSIAEASQIEHNTEGGIEYAKLKVTIALKVESSSFSIEEEYILRQDESGRWKILGWNNVEKKSTTEEGEQGK